MQEQSQSDFWSISQLYEAFIQVYADYPVKFNPTPEGFRIRLSKLNLDKYFTATYMSQEKIAGFILYTINDYQSKKQLIWRRRGCYLSLEEKRYRLFV